MPRKRPLRPLLPLMVAGLMSSPAWGQNDDVEARIQAGIYLRDSDRSLEALAHFSRLWTATQYPRALAQVAVTEQVLGRWVQAEEHFRAVLALRAHPWVQENRARIEASLAAVSPRVSTVRIVGAAPNTQIVVDGQVRGRTPAITEVRVAAGDVGLELYAAGYRTLRRTVRARGGAVVQEVVVQTVEAGAPASAPDMAAAPGVPTRTTTQPAVEPGPQRTIGWVALGLSVLGVGAGIATSEMREERLRALIVECPMAGWPRCGAIADEISTRAIAMGVGFGAAGALAITGIILVATAPRAPAARPSATRPLCGIGPGSVACTFSF